MSFYSVCYKISAKFFRFLYQVHVTGSENEPETGAAIVACNHIANADVIVLASAFKRQVRYLAKKELFKVPLVGSIVRALGAFPIDRSGGDVGAVKKTISLLKEGNLVGIYPQGHRYPGVDPRTTPIKNGVALVSAHADCPIIPAFIRTKGNRIVIFKRIDVFLGEPITREELLAAGDDYKSQAEYVFKKITDLESREAKS